MPILMPWVAGVFYRLSVADALSTAKAADAEIAVLAREADAASRKFVEENEAVYNVGSPPRQTDPKAAPFLDKVFATDMLRSKLPAYDDTSALFLWLHAAARVSSVYELAGTGYADVRKVPAEGQAFSQFQAQTAKNVVAYAPEVGRAADATIVLNGAIADILAALPIDLTERVKRNWEATRSNMAVLIAGNLQYMLKAGLTDVSGEQMHAVLVRPDDRRRRSWRS